MKIDLETLEEAVQCLKATFTLRYTPQSTNGPEKWEIHCGNNHNSAAPNTVTLICTGNSIEDVFVEFTKLEDIFVEFTKLAKERHAKLINHAADLQVLTKCVSLDPEIET